MITFPEVSSFCKKFIVIYLNASLANKILLLAILFNFAAAINIVLIFPIFFNIIIIPGIKKKLGVRIIEWPSLIYSYFMGSFFLPPVLTAKCIVKTYVCYKFKGSSGGARGVLKNIGYNVRVMSKFELVMSFLFVLNIVFIIIGGAIVFIFHEVAPKLSH